MQARETGSERKRQRRRRRRGDGKEVGEKARRQEESGSDQAGRDAPAAPGGCRSRRGASGAPADPTTASLVSDLVSPEIANR
eukprot:4980503-Pleurochrysis_carterae.AAC.1